MTSLDQKLSTGVPGLDDILAGGLPQNCMYLVEGNPGVGKTTLALQFLMEGRSRGEMGLYVTLSETKLELEAVARSHRWNLEGISIIELSAFERALGGTGPTTLFHSAEVELTQLTKLLVGEIERTRPASAGSRYASGSSPKPPSAFWHPLTQRSARCT